WSLSSIRNQVTGHLPAGRPVAGRGERCRTAPRPPLIVLSGVVVGGPEVSASLGPAGRLCRAFPLAVLALDLADPLAVALAVPPLDLTASFRISCVQAPLSVFVARRAVPPLPGWTRRAPVLLVQVSLDALPELPVTTARSPRVLQVRDEPQVHQAHTPPVLAHVVNRHARLDGAAEPGPNHAMAE